ncbi:MAG: ABC transporter ATP-binding protein [Ectothiorhodospiraceae bacterium]|nr:ABC transporter ATP-binding protein [Chromatiales bacterium]MCP5154954.1 ABC transporter ATP-binding protein [Ectothiorhodospiraceae bacterium]
MFGAAFDGVVVRRFWGFVRPYRRLLAVAVVGVVIFTLTQVMVPLLVRYAVDHAMAEGSGEVALLRAIALGFLAVVSVNYASNITQELMVGRIAGHLLFDLRRAMYRHLQDVSLGFMDKTEVGRLMSRLQGDVSALQEFLETSIFAIGDFVLLLGIVTVLLTLDVRLGLLTLAVVPALLLVRLVWLPRARAAFLRARETSSAVNGALAENVHGVRAIQEMVREPVNYTLFEDKAGENLRSHMVASRYSNAMVPVVELLTGAAMAVVVVVGGSMVLDDALPLGVMVAFLFYVQRFFDPIRSLTLQYSIMQRAMASGQRIFEVLDVPVDVRERDSAQDLAPDAGASIEFRDVTFGYEPGRPVLERVSFRVEPGETVALVGPTGSGKTSTMALVKRFYDVWEGQVLVGGHDVRELTRRTLGRNIAMVLQEPFLFSGTIADNIRYQKTEASQAEVEAAARAVGAHDFIMRLPHGYDTELDQRGTNISLGQRQLVSFARALVADAPILVLDEATANVDSYTERQIQRALARLLEGRTAMVIAHRLATVRGADRILVLQDGKLIERGNHDELVAHGGLYARLYRLNHASFDDL